MKLGSNDISSVKIGSTDVNKIYIGSTEVWSAANPLLDDYPGAAAAYSLRLLSSTYTGNAIRVRRASDNAESDIGFVSGELDTSTLETFCSGTNGFVKTWYDQSGNGNDASQTTAANQPQIVSSGSVLMQNSKPQIQDGLDKDLITSYSLSNKTCWIFGAISTYDDLMVYISAAPGVPNAFLYAIDTTSTSYNSNASITTQYLNGSIINPSTRNDLYNLFETNTTRPLKLSSINATFASGYGILSFGYGNAQNGLLNMSEVIIYPSDQSSNRTGIETNINDFYSIY